MIKKHKKYNRPRKPFDIVRIKSENEIVNKYGLKNKREIWKSKAKLDSIRRGAKKLLQESSEEEQKVFLNKLAKLGYNMETVVDVLALTEEDILRRRLQTVVLKKGLATTTRGARQLITHKHIAINDKIVNIPSYHVFIEEENNIKKVGMKTVKPVKKPIKEPAVVNPKEEITGESEGKTGDEDINKVEEKPMEVSA